MPGSADVVDVGELAGHFGRNVHARDRLADHLVVGRLLECRSSDRPRASRRRRSVRRSASARSGDWPSRARRHPRRSSSLAGTPSRCAARSTSARRALAAARRSSEPPWKIVRLPAVSHWSGVVAVSPITISIRSNGTSSSSAASCASAVRAPVPRSTLPQKIVTRLSGLMVSHESIASLATDFGAAERWRRPGRQARHREADGQNAARLQEGRGGRTKSSLDSSCSPPSSRSRRALHSGDDAFVGAAAAQIVGERGANIAPRSGSCSSRAMPRRS